MDNSVSLNIGASLEVYESQQLGDLKVFRQDQCVYITPICKKHKLCFPFKHLLHHMHVGWIEGWMDKFP